MSPGPCSICSIGTRGVSCLPRRPAISQHAPPCATQGLAPNCHCRVKGPRLRNRAGGERSATAAKEPVAGRRRRLTGSAERAAGPRVPGEKGGVREGCNEAARSRRGRAEVGNTGGAGSEEGSSGFGVRQSLTKGCRGRAGRPAGRAPRSDRPAAAVLRFLISLEREASRLHSAGGPLPITQPWTDFQAGGAGRRAEPQSQPWVGTRGPQPGPQTQAGVRTERRHSNVRGLGEGVARAGCGFDVKVLRKR